MTGFSALFLFVVAAAGRCKSADFYAILWANGIGIGVVPSGYTAIPFREALETASASLKAKRFFGMRRRSSERSVFQHPVRKIPLLRSLYSLDFIKRLSVMESLLPEHFDCTIFWRTFPPKNSAESLLSDACVTPTALD